MSESRNKRGCVSWQTVYGILRWRACHYRSGSKDEKLELIAHLDPEHRISVYKSPFTEKFHSFLSFYDKSLDGCVLASVEDLTHSPDWTIAEIVCAWEAVIARESPEVFLEAVLAHSSEDEL